MLHISFSRQQLPGRAPRIPPEPSALVLNITNTAANRPTVFNARSIATPGRYLRSSKALAQPCSPLNQLSRQLGPLGEKRIGANECHTEFQIRRRIVTELAQEQTFEDVWPNRCHLLCSCCMRNTIYCQGRQCLLRRHQFTVRHPCWKQQHRALSRLCWCFWLDTDQFGWHKLSHHLPVMDVSFKLGELRA